MCMRIDAHSQGSIPFARQVALSTIFNCYQGTAPLLDHEICIYFACHWAAMDERVRKEHERNCLASAALTTLLSGSNEGLASEP